MSVGQVKVNRYFRVAVDRRFVQVLFNGLRQFQRIEGVERTQRFNAGQATESIHDALRGQFASMRFIQFHTHPTFHVP